MEPPAKRTRINHVSSPAKLSRFPAPTGSPTMSEVCKGYVPQNTTTWAMRVLKPGV